MSRKLSLDFVTQAPFAMRRLTGIGLTLFLLGLALTAYAFFQGKVAQTALEQAEASLADVKPLKAEQPVVKAVAVNVLSSTELQQANKTAALLDIQWHALFSSLEQIKMRNIALLSIEPNVKKQRLVLTGQAKHMQAILDYAAQVETLPMLTRVHLQKHQVEEETPFKPVSFTIVARWL